MAETLAFPTQYAHQLTPPPLPEPLAFDAKALAAALAVSVRTIRSWDAAGKLPEPVRVGVTVRWPVALVRKWMDAGCPDRATFQTLQKQSR